MTGLLIAATKFEVQSCIKLLKKSVNWHCVITGIGSVATAYTVLKAIEKFKPQIIIQAGIGGTFDQQIALGSVVTIGSDCLGDLGVVENKNRKSIFDLKLMANNGKPFTNSRLVNPHKKIMRQTLLQVVDAVSVNEITTSKGDIKDYKNELNVAVESMEGAAFHYVALKEKIPFVQIRGISNLVGERKKEKWNVKLAIENLNVEVMKIINKLNLSAEAVIKKSL